jgi:hypothetical protein
MSVDYLENIENVNITFHWNNLTTS